MNYDEQEHGRSFDLHVWRHLLVYLKPHRRLVVRIIIFILLSAVIDIALPLFQRYAIDHFIEEHTTRRLFSFGLIYFATIFLQAVFVMIFARASMQLEMRFGRDLKSACFTHLQTLSLSYFNVTPVGYIHTRVMSDTTRIASLIAWNSFDIFWSLTYVIGVFVAMLLLNVRLALFILLIVPIIALLTVYFQSRILQWNRTIRKLNSKITGSFNEGISGVKATKTLVIEDQNSADFQKITESMRTSSIRAAHLSAVYVPLVLFVSSAAVAIVLTQGGSQVQKHLLMLGTLSAFTSYAVGIFEPIQQLARNIADFISIQACIERITGLLREKPLITDTPEVEKQYGNIFHPKRENWPPLQGDITFDDVTFQYPDGNEEVLSHFNLHIPAGTTVAIVGETGAGKSTLVNLVCRFFEPTQGRILIDGIDYRQRSQLWLHSNIGYVLQTPHLFSGSIADNIRYGRLDATDAEIRAAAKAVSADTVVSRLERGYDSPVGEGGDRLSTGEKQLISFARAVLADPRIFILDEATSSIDTETEQLIQAAISHILKGRTSFLIAHRLSTIRHADLILVVRNGKIVEKGRHEDLLEQKGYYFTLYHKHFSEESTQSVLQG